MTREEINNLLEVAIKAEKNSFTFKSKHSFGAAVLTTDGEYFGGCNIDGVISSQGICAEMNAVNHMVIHGKYNIKAVLVVDETEFIYPCGACLQYLGQFYQTTNSNIEIISAKHNGEYQSKTLGELLPNVYLSSSYSDIFKTYKNKND